MANLKVVKAVHVLTRALGWAVVASVACLILYGFFLWAVNHFLSFGIVFGVIGAIGLVGAYFWSDDILTEEKEAEEFFQKNKRYETDTEKRDRKRREELRHRANRGY